MTWVPCQEERMKESQTKCQTSTSEKTAPKKIPKYHTNTLHHKFKHNKIDSFYKNRKINKNIYKKKYHQVQIIEKHINIINNDNTRVTGTSNKSSKHANLFIHKIK